MEQREWQRPVDAADRTGVLGPVELELIEPLAHSWDSAVRATNELLGDVSPQVVACRTPVPQSIGVAAWLLKAKDYASAMRWFGAVEIELGATLAAFGLRVQLEGGGDDLTESAARAQGDELTLLGVLRVEANAEHQAVGESATDSWSPSSIS